MQQMLETYTDFSIRRACAFVAFGGVTLMLALSTDLSLACRVGAQVAALLLLGLVAAAWRAPRRNLRHSEVYALLKDAGLPKARLAETRMQEMLAEILRDRLLWHAERVGWVAVALWGAALVLFLLK